MRSSLVVIGAVLLLAVAGCDTGTTTSTTSPAQKRLNARIALAYESQPGFKTTWCRKVDQAGRQDPQAAVRTLNRILGPQIRKLGGDPDSVLIRMLDDC